MAAEKDCLQMELNSPPKPTRMITIEEPPCTQPLTHTSYTSSLPALAGEVAVAQKHQLLKLEEKFDVLQQMKEHYHKALRNKVMAERDSQAIARKSHVLQDDIETCQALCAKILKENGTLVKEVELLKRNISSVEIELSVKRSENKEYKDKMASYRNLVNQVEASSEVNQNIAKEKSDIEKLRTEKELLVANLNVDKLLSGEIRQTTLAEILALQETKNKLECSLKQNTKFDEEVSKQTKLRRDMELLQKKYQAQLTWTRKQLQETLTRNKQRREEATQKEQQIQETKEKIKKL